MKVCLHFLFYVLFYSFHFFFVSFSYVVYKSKRRVSIASVGFANISNTFVPFKALYVITFTRGQKLSLMPCKQ
jgi:hypothetical protein